MDEHDDGQRAEMDPAADEAGLWFVFFWLPTFVAGGISGMVYFVTRSVGCTLWVFGLMMLFPIGNRMSTQLHQITWDWWLGRRLRDNVDREHSSR